MLNITAISFSISAILAAGITWRCFYIWRLQKENNVPRIFFQATLFFTLYMAVRAIFSIFFVGLPNVLTWGYIVSHIFLGLASASLARFAVASFFNMKLANKIFAGLLALFSSDIILNIILPNNPSLNTSLNIIEWGTNKYVGIYHTALLWLVFLSAAILFIYKAIQNRRDREVKLRSLIIASGLLLNIIVVIPRNIFDTPIFILISDIGYALTFGLIFLGVSGRFSKKSENF
jgi:hypothetical protein